MQEKTFKEIYSELNKAPWTFSEIPVELKELLESKIIQPETKVLEIGCGEGHHAIFLAKNKLKVTAIDSSELAIQYANENAKKQNVKVEFKQKHFTALDKLSEKFDFIYDWRFFHEIKEERERENYLKMISNLLSPMGKYLSVAFSGDSDFMGTGKLRISPAGIKIYFAKLEEDKKKFEKYFKVIEAKWIEVPQKPNLKIKANYLLVNKK